ncbi:flavin reductase family protein, partial [Paracoccaceae bacterium]|nr:flavin reductase family protein [Paracoccaceae bacterium]
MSNAVRPPDATNTPLDSGAFRSALGRFATGITIITCSHNGQPMGLTANSFASVSLDPPLVLWSPAKASRRHVAFSQATHFAIHILEASQEALCRSFARPGDGFKNLEWQAGAQNVPLFP